MDKLTQLVECQWGHSVFLNGNSSQECGVAILLSKDLKCKCETLFKDRLGRCLVMKFEVNDVSFIVCNVYFPTADHENMQIRLLSLLEEVLHPHEGGNIIIAGDFNVIMNRKLESFNLVGQSIRNPDFRSELNVMLETFSLCDPWRIRHWSEKLFTWSRAGKGSRLDYIFTPEYWLNFISVTTFQDVSFSDHRLICVGFNTKESVRGKGFLRVNNYLLEKQEVFEDLCQMIEEKKVEYLHMSSVLKWELIKFHAREILLGWQTRLRREKNELQKDLQSQIDELTRSFRGNDDNNQLEALNALKRELYALQLGSERINMIKSKCKWALYGGKPTKFFLNLEKQNQTDKSIEQLFNTDGLLVTNTKEILAMGEQHFKEIYTPTVIDSQDPDMFSSQEHSSLDDLERETFEDDISLIELEEALKSMKANKCPGSDGFTVEFYRKLWPKINKLILESFNESFNTGILSPEQRRGVISLIPKKNRDRRFLSHWRPITLLNVDYKLLAKCISRRMFHVMPKLVHPDQVGFIPGRFIGTNIRNINDVIEFLNNSEDGGLVVSLDYSMAFDRIDRDFLFKVLKSFHFGEKFSKWIRILYNGAEACMLNKGFSSQWFQVNAGLRQGCPLSPFLFFLCAEKLADSIRNAGNITGISISGKEHKLMQYADDLTLFVKNGNSLEAALSKLDEFQTVSGLKINLSKSFGLKVNTDTEIGTKGENIQFQNKMTILGVPFYNDRNEEDQMVEDFDKYINKMCKVCEVWKKRKIPLKGKVVILNVLVFPIIYYAATNRYCPKKIQDRVKNLTVNILWNGNSSKVSITTLSQETAQGGLGLHDFEKRLAAARLAWVKKNHKRSFRFLVGLFDKGFKC